MFPRIHQILIVILLVQAFGRIACADLVLGLVGDKTWDRNSQPAGPDPVLFTVQSNNVSPSDNLMNAFSVGLRLVPSNGATGSIVLQAVSIPQNNPVFATYGGGDLVLSTIDSTFKTISADNSAFANVSIPAAGRSLFTAQFSSPGNNASGRFDIYADPTTSNYFTTTNFNGNPFGNAIANQNGIYLGSINAITAVPEPSSILFASATAGLFVLYVARKRMRRNKVNSI